MLIKAPSKINLTLKILSKRADGYHEISSLMRAIRLFDEVEIDLHVNGAHNVDPLRFEGTHSAASKSELFGHTSASASYANRRGFSGCEPPCARINITTNTADIPKGQKNLAWQAADLAVKELAGGLLDGRIEISIKKNIPIAAGLGGGSSDAAAVLLWTAKTLAPQTQMSDLVKLGAKIGADVPFCLYACAAANPLLGFKGTNSALAEGLGEIVTIMPEAEKASIILVKPDIKVHTKDVYALYDDSITHAADPVSDSHTSDSHTVGPIPDNDLEAPCTKEWPAVAETIADLKNLCVAAGANKAKVQMSGSGPTVFAYFGEDHFCAEASATAKSVYENAKTQFKDSFVYLTETL